jgi:hypothetical protein
MVIYGIGKTDIIIVIGNSIGVSLNIAMLVLKMKYSRKPLQEERIVGLSSDLNYIFRIILLNFSSNILIKMMRPTGLSYGKEGSLILQ